MSKNRDDILIYALDHDDVDEAREWVERLISVVKIFKIGYQLFYREGPRAVEMVKDHGADVFLDLKLHDIPRTVEMAAREAARMGVKIVNVHAGGGRAMMEAAAAGAKDEADKLGAAAPAVLGVTILTSLDDQAVREIGFSGGAEEMVLGLAGLARTSGLGGVVASAREAKVIRQRTSPEFIILCPGIRPAGTDHGDQARVMTPKDAVESGADYIVVGRPIRSADDPVEQARLIAQEASSAFASRD